VPAEVLEQILNCCLAPSFTPHNDRKLRLPELTSNGPALSERQPATFQTPVNLPRLKEGDSSLIVQALAAAGKISRVSDQRPGPSNGVAKATPVQPKVQEVHSNVSNSATEPTQAGVRVGVVPQGSRHDSEAPKKLIGQMSVAAPPSRLPERKLSRSALVSSSAFWAFLVVILFSLPISFLPKLVTKMMDGASPIAAPQTQAPLPPVLQVGAQPIPPQEQVPPQQSIGELITPTQLAPRKAKSAEGRGPEVSGTNHDSTKDPNGLSGSRDPNKDANIGHFGSRSVPGGTDYGNGTGEANDVRSTVASAGFGNSIPVPPPGGSGNSRDEVKSSVLAAATVESESSKPKANDAAAVVVQPLVILDKPSPVYTEEARRLAIEGEVLMEVIFSASGQVRIVRVVKGLGHGLDEAAISSAQQIRFEPAQQNGQPVDVPATVHIVFQLAF
jgi:TonB family protein